MFWARGHLILTAPCLGAALQLAAAPPAAAAQDVNAADVSIRMLRNAATPQRDGSHLSLLFALRQLHDSDLHAFFEHLLQSSQWQIQVHAILGLGEISPGKFIEAAWVRQLAAPAQDAAIATALDLNLLAKEQFPAILSWTDLQPMARLVLVAELVSLTQAVDQQPLRELAESADDHVAGLAASLLEQLGDHAPFAAFGSRLEALDPPRRQAVEFWLLEAIRRYHLTACVPWAKAVLQRPAIDPDVAYRGAYALLDLDATAGLETWNRMVGQQPTYPQRVRLGMMLLSTESAVPAAAYDRLIAGADEDLILKMSAAGKAIAAKSDPTEALIALLDLEHPKTAAWAMGHIEKLPPDQAAPIYTRIIDRLEKAQNQEGDSISLAVRAVSKLYAIDPAPVLDRLHRAEDDSLLQQTILLGLFETDSAVVGQAAATLRRLGVGRADSLALLLIAKHSKALAPADVELLGKIASGGGRVSEILQVQAAWLYLKHTGQLEKALAAISNK